MKKRSRRKSEYPKSKENIGLNGLQNLNNMKKRKKKTGKIFRFAFFLLLMIGIAGGLKGYKMYRKINCSNLKIKKDTYIYIPTNASYEEVESILLTNDYLLDSTSFDWVADKKNYKNQIKSGRYKLTKGMSNNELINLLRSGKQTPVRLSFEKIRTKNKFVEKIAEQIEVDATELLNLLNDENYLHKFDKNKYTAFCLFIPNTYEFYWNTSATKFMERMAKEQKRFWNEKRLEKAKKINLSTNEVYTLASIVEEETTKNNEKPTIAGVYLNRLKKNMRLQADPTIKFSIGDFFVQRILNKHLEHDSPYNTYKNIGLPPGPICIPSIKSIDAVLNYEVHNYLYFCAKDDFSGYHVFAKTLLQHNQNAKKYRQALNRKRIYR